MSNSINLLKKTLGLGARANKFNVEIQAPVKLDGRKISILTKEATIPEATVGAIDVYAGGGRMFKVAGDKSYSGSFVITLYAEQNHGVRKSLEDWIDIIDNFEDNSRAITDSNSHEDYMSQSVKVQQLDTSTNEVTAEYEFYNMFIVNLSELTLSSESQDTILEYTAEFSYSHYKRTI